MVLVQGPSLEIIVLELTSQVEMATAGPNPFHPLTHHPFHTQGQTPAGQLLGVNNRSVTLPFLYVLWFSFFFFHSPVQHAFDNFPGLGIS